MEDILPNGRGLFLMSFWGNMFVILSVAHMRGLPWRTCGRLGELSRLGGLGVANHFDGHVMCP